MRARSLPHLIVAALALASLGNTPAKKPPAPPLEPKKQASAPSGAALLAQPLDTMVLLSGGAFTVGSTPLEIVRAIELCRGEVLGELCQDYPFAHEHQAHTVYLEPFFLDRTEVTVGSYRRCVSAGDCASPSFASGDPKFDRDDLPVTHVGYDDAVRYCAFRGGRLPTEAEWERAARGAAGRQFPWGNLPNGKLGNHGALDLGSLFLPQTGVPLLGIPDASDGFAGLAPVGSFPSGSTPDGIHDLAGNVSEWVHDYFGDQFSAAAAANPKGPTAGSLRVVRGGSYRHPISMIRGASRDRRPPSTREPTIGIRCAKDAKPSP